MTIIEQTYNKEDHKETFNFSLCLLTQFNISDEPINRVTYNAHKPSFLAKTFQYACFFHIFIGDHITVSSILRTTHL